MDKKLKKIILGEIGSELENAKINLFRAKAYMCQIDMFALEQTISDIKKIMSDIDNASVSLADFINKRNH